MRLANRANRANRAKRAYLAKRRPANRPKTGPWPAGNSEQTYRLVWAFSVSSTARSNDEILAGEVLRFLSAT